MPCTVQNSVATESFHLDTVVINTQRVEKSLLEGGAMQLERGILGNEEALPALINSFSVNNLKERKDRGGRSKR